MKENHRGHQAANWREIEPGRVMKAQKASAAFSQGVAPGKVLPFAVPQRKSSFSVDIPRDRTRVQELKARIQSGRYRVSSLRLAGKMIREALLEDLSCQKRGAPKAER